MTNTTTRRTPPAVRQEAHALAFLQTLSAGTHRAPDVYAYYEASATEHGAVPLGRTTFHSRAAEALGRRWSAASGDVYRVASDWTISDALHAFARDYPAERDALDGFLPGVYVSEPSSRVAATAVFADFEAFAAKHGLIELRRWSRQAFYRALEERGYVRKRSTGGKFVVLGLSKAP
jgi:hypothetical protein